jgi:hypothetical protein
MVLEHEKLAGALSVLWIHESVTSNRPMHGANPGTHGGGHDTGDRSGPSHCGPRHDLRGATQPGGASSLLPVREREIFYNLPALHGDVAETLHRHAKLTLDDMIVMGAYVHSRLRQMVLGGTTQSLFKDCPVPLFLSY